MSALWRSFNCWTSEIKQIEKFNLVYFYVWPIYIEHKIDHTLYTHYSSVALFEGISVPYSIDTLAIRKLKSSLPFDGIVHHFANVLFTIGVE
jgi:hypothetical protein